MKNKALVQEIKRYLHQAEKNRDCSIDVKFEDIDEKNSSNVLFCLYALQADNYLKIIGLKFEKGCSVDENPYNIKIFSEGNCPKYANVVLAKDFEEIDSKLELIYRKDNREVWINNMFIKGFNPNCEKHRYQIVFEESYYNAGKKLQLNQFKIFNELKIQRLDTAITNALNTLDVTAIEYFFPILATKELRCEQIAYDNDTMEFLRKQPTQYEVDPYQQGKWSDD